MKPDKIEVAGRSRDGGGGGGGGLTIISSKKQRVALQMINAFHSTGSTTRRNERRIGEGK